MAGDVPELARRAAFLIGSILAAACLVLFTILLWNSTADSQSTGGTASAASYSGGSSSQDSPNLITTDLSASVAQAGKRLQSISGNFGASVGGAVGSAASATADVASGTMHAIGTGLSAAGRGVASAAVFVARIPVNILGFFGGLFTNAPVVSSAIRPVDHDEIPIIDPNSPELAAAQNALPATTNQGGSGLPAEPVWPVHGAVTTEFGVYHMPYQSTHTGIDISDGSRPGTTAVHPFRHGSVIEVSTVGGLGNHVVIDHGGGVTSVYAHLASISVQPGQAVDTNSVIGMQGTTGVSTGTHLHFEIRVNGQAANPRSFISGQP